MMIQLNLLSTPSNGVIQPSTLTHLRNLKRKCSWTGENQTLKRVLKCHFISKNQIKRREYRSHLTKREVAALEISLKSRLKLF